MAGSVKTSRRKPKPGTATVYPKLSGPGLTSIIVTASTSPRWAPLTNSGPVRGWIRFRLAAATVAGVDVRLKGLSNASRVSKITVSPELASAASGMSGCQRLWQVRSGSSPHGTGTPPAPRLTGMRTVVADEGNAAAAASAAVISSLFMVFPLARGAIRPRERDCQLRSTSCRAASRCSSRYQAGKFRLLVYESKYAGSNQATAVTWDVGSDLEKVVQGLKAKGVVFEQYDLPEMTRKGDIHQAGRMKAAWFKDPTATSTLWSAAELADSSPGEVSFQNPSARVRQ